MWRGPRPTPLPCSLVPNKVPSSCVCCEAGTLGEGESGGPSTATKPLLLMYLLKCSLLLVLTTFSRFPSTHMSGLHLIGNPSQVWHIREEVCLSYVIRCLDLGSRSPGSSVLFCLYLLLSLMDGVLPWGYKMAAALPGRKKSSKVAKRGLTSRVFLFHEESRSFPASPHLVNFHLCLSFARIGFHGHPWL